jgi:hypothetical protein
VRAPAGVDGLLQLVERAGANIAVDDAERREHHNGGQPSGVLLRHPIGRLKGLGHPNVPSLNFESMHENGALESL